MIEINAIIILREDKLGLLFMITDQKHKCDKNVDNLCRNATRKVNIMYIVEDVFQLKEKGSHPQGCYLFKC